MARDVDTCFNYCGESPVTVAYFSSDELRWINKIHKLKDTHPDDVEILKEPEDNDGCIYCKLPVSWLKIQPPRNLTDEERQTIANRLNVTRKNEQ